MVPEEVSGVKSASVTWATEGLQVKTRRKITYAYLFMLLVRKDHDLIIACVREYAVIHRHEAVILKIQVYEGIVKADALFAPLMQLTVHFPETFIAEEHDDLFFAHGKQFFTPQYGIAVIN